MNEIKREWTGTAYPIFDMFIDGLIRAYTAGAILRWTALPFSIRKNMILSNRYHNGGDRSAWVRGLFGETSWTVGNLNNQPCDGIVDDFLLQVSPDHREFIIVMNDKDYDDLISFVLEGIEVERECSTTPTTHD